MGRSQPLTPDGQDKNISSTFSHIHVFSLFFHQSFFIFLPHFGLPDPPIREGPGYATVVHPCHPLQIRYWPGS